MESQLVLISVAAVTVLSGATATILTLTVDVRKRPLMHSLVEGLMRIALLGAGTLVALRCLRLSMASQVKRPCRYMPCPFRVERRRQHHGNGTRSSLVSRQRRRASPSVLTVHRLAF
jgi:hypothetical protein